MREKIDVLFIDDKPFIYLEDLRNEHFKLTQINDIEDFKSVVSYPVVICDIQGVGTKFDKEKQGAYVVKNLKKLYPFKQVAVYSSGNYDVSLLSDLNGIETIDKDVDKDMWGIYIDELIAKAANPIYVWKNIRTYLLQKNVSIKEVMFLEHDYVKLILDKSEKLSDFPNKKQYPSLSDEIRDIVKSIIASGILKLLGL